MKRPYKYKRVRHITCLFLKELVFLTFMGFSMNTKLNNENHSDYKHVTCPDFCIIKKMLLPIALTPQGEFIEANKARQH